MLFLRDAADRSIFRTSLRIYTSISFSLEYCLERGLLDECQGTLSNKNARSQTVTDDSLSCVVEPHTNRVRVHSDDIDGVSCYQQRIYNWQTLTLVITYIRFGTGRYLFIRRNVRYTNDTKTVRWRHRSDERSLRHQDRTVATSVGRTFITTPRPYGGDVERAVSSFVQSRGG